MKIPVNQRIRPTLALAAIALLLQPAAMAQQKDSSSGRETTASQQSAVSPAEKMTVAEAQAGEQELPDSPGAMQSQTNAEDQPPPQQQNSLHEPVGTAAAEWMPITGVAASRPAGAALAPAKQRRARSILIKVGALVGAGVAVGTVAALSAGSPSRPAGAR
jgi:hypothetical protein